jgi:putative dimethyl sulfoxide reductase chaperone
MTTAHAEAAALLSSWWSRPVQDVVAAWEEAWPFACDVADELGLEAGAVEDLAADRRGATPDELLLEYERLFVGPGRTPCSPYESLWLRDQPGPERGRLMGAASTAVADLYRELGLDVSAAARELPDHIAIEWEALACAWQSDAPAAAGVAEALLGEHLGLWLPEFCAAVQEASQIPFYATLASLTRSWVEAFAAECPAGP